MQREQAEILDALQGFAGRQTALTAESRRIFKQRARKSFGAEHAGNELDRRRTGRKSLAAELKQFSAAKLKDSKVVLHLLHKAAEAMAAVEPAIETVRAGPMDLDSWEEDRRTVQSPQQTASRRLKQLIDAIRESENPSESRRMESSLPLSSPVRADRTPMESPMSSN